MRRIKGREVPIANAFIQELQVALPEVADYLSVEKELVRGLVKERVK